MNEEQINNIKQEYYAGRIEKTKGGIKNWIKRFGYERRVQSSDNIDAEDRKSNIDDVRLASETYGRESRPVQSFEDSSTNLGKGSVKTNLDGTQVENNKTDL